MTDLFISGVKLLDNPSDEYPYNISAVKALANISFTSPVTFFVGENGMGKSTIIEGLAIAAGFSAEGGTKNYHYSTEDSSSKLGKEITLVRGIRREKYGYFLRAESFYTTANYAEKGTFGAAGPIPILFDGKRIHEQSHGEAFISITNSFRPGLFIFDEPESALSPTKQLELMQQMHKLVKQDSQFIISTHSPILLAYPGAEIYQLSKNKTERVDFNDVHHVKMYREFLNDPSNSVNDLFDGSSS